MSGGRLDTKPPAMSTPSPGRLGQISHLEDLRLSHAYKVEQRVLSGPLGEERPLNFANQNPQSSQKPKWPEEQLLK